TTGSSVRRRLRSLRRRSRSSYASFTPRRDEQAHGASTDDDARTRQTVGVRFDTEHEFEATPGAVAQILMDPEFHTHLDLPDLSRPEVESQETSGSERTLKLRYEFVGSLDPIARRILAGRRLTWIQTMVFDTATGAGSLAFAAEADPKRLYGNASVRL